MATPGPDGPTADVVIDSGYVCAVRIVGSDADGRVVDLSVRAGEVVVIHPTPLGDAVARALLGQDATQALVVEVAGRPLRVGAPPPPYVAVVGPAEETLRSLHAIGAADRADLVVVDLRGVGETCCAEVAAVVRDLCEVHGRTVAVLTGQTPGRLRAEREIR